MYLRAWQKLKNTIWAYNFLCVKHLRFELFTFSCARYIHVCLLFQFYQKSPKGQRLLFFKLPHISLVLLVASSCGTSFTQVILHTHNSFAWVCVCVCACVCVCVFGCLACVQWWIFLINLMLNYTCLLQEETNRIYVQTTRQVETHITLLVALNVLFYKSTYNHLNLHHGSNMVTWWRRHQCFTIFGNGSWWVVPKVAWNSFNE